MSFDAWVLIALASIILFCVNGLIGCAIQRWYISPLVYKYRWLFDQAVPYTAGGVFFATAFWQIWLLWFWYWYRKGEQPHS